jgi:type II secretory pathway predicted ATPase ExeA
VDKFPSPNPFGRTLAASSVHFTYEPYYGLREKPFSLSTDPRFLYRSAEHARTFDDLLLAIRRREGLIVLTGDIGTGKTTLCKAVLEKLDRKTFSTFVPDPFITREDLLKRLLIDFGVMSVDDLRGGKMQGATSSDLSYPLCEFLKSLVPLQAFAVLIIDETQNMSLPLLEEIRILSDLEAPEKLLQVVLVGQLELREKLKLPEMRQLDQRVSARCSLQGLTRDAVAGYIAHRLSVAGASEDRVCFAPDALDSVCRVSGGVPRVINLICDRALYLGYLQHKNVIDLEVVERAVDDLGVGNLTAAPQEETSMAPTAVEAPDAQPMPPVAAGLSSLDPDLSGLEVHDIPNDLSAPIAAPIAPEPIPPPQPSFTPVLSLRGNASRTMLDESTAARIWRERAKRVALAVCLFLAFGGFVVFGELLLMSYYPDPADQVIQPPPSPPPPQMARPSTPVEVPPEFLLDISALGRDDRSSYAALKIE